MVSSLKTYVPAGRTARPGISTGALKVNTVSSSNSSALAEEPHAAIRIVIQKNNSIIRNFFIGSTSDSLFAFRRIPYSLRQDAFINRSVVLVLLEFGKKWTCRCLISASEERSESRGHGEVGRRRELLLAINAHKEEGAGRPGGRHTSCPPSLSDAAS